MVQHQETRIDDLKDRRCPFCNVASESVILENDAALAIWDKHPVTDGHALVIPKRHVNSVYDLPAAEQAKLWELVGVMRKYLSSSGADSFNIGLNDGKAAGQTVDHAHIHVIPRRIGDCPDPSGGIRLIFPDKARYW